ncbi:PAS domain S-box-containing protein [Motilibacter rhizosphaerae]|uniref:histidine kinase n=1 Tax=Motilibacter rhizosphaerae TaxID=598652 RepID=A0A4Q7N7I9_9ACTN|nr:PAS domain S-box protein [Motilibacter rhizosphaerae]RZS77904.1 PAS domain S-box-containing protein [Motilibacter rhizosphaerae]
MARVGALGEPVGGEALRLAALHEYALLDTPAGDELEAVVRLAAAVAGVPTATLNLVDEDRQCQLTTVGFEGQDSARSDSMCAVRFLEGRTVWTRDACLHPDYAGNPWVTGVLAAVRFYASVPLVTPAGHALGTLCVFDSETRELTDSQLALLEDAARVVLALFERRRQARENARLAAQADEQRELLEHAVRELAERQEFTDAVLETVEVGIVAADAEGRLTLFNQAARDWHGLDADHSLQPAEHAERYHLTHADGVTRLAPHEVPLARALHEGKVSAVEMVIAPDGRPPTRVLASGRALTAADGTLLGAVVAQSDITDQRVREAGLAEAHAALAASEERLRLAFHHSPLGVFLTSLQPGEVGRFLFANPAVCRMTGYSDAELTGGMTFRDLQHPDDHASTAEHLQRLISGETDEGTLERRYRHRDGHLLHVTLHAAVVRGEDGIPSHLVTQVQDVTEARRARREIARQARLVDAIPSPVIVRDLDGTILFWSAGAQAAYGHPATAAVGQITHDLLATRFPLPLADLEQALAVEGCWSGELQHTAADGRQLTVLSSMVRHEPDDGTAPVILEINTDITALRHAERALAASERRWRAQFAHSSVGQAVRGLDDRILEVNPAFAAMLGRAPEELVDATMTELIAPEARRARASHLTDLHAGNADSAGRETLLLAADGRRVPAHVSVSLVKDEDGAPERVVALFTDITARRAAEAARDAAAAALADRNVQLERANRLKLDLIGMVGHELGNPLASILGYSELANENWHALDDDDKRGNLAVIERNARTLARTLAEVLALVSLDAGQLRAHPETVHLSGVLDAAAAHAPRTDQCVVSCPQGLAVHVQPGHLDQILANLLSNAAKYAGGATALTATARPDGTVEIHVTDNGPGIPADLYDRLFTRFARADSTSRTVKGTGLGLYITRELARANAGDIAHRPSPSGTGSTFVLTLPAA